MGRSQKNGPENKAKFQITFDFFWIIDCLYVFEQQPYYMIDTSCHPIILVTLSFICYVFPPHHPFFFCPFRFLYSINCTTTLQHEPHQIICSFYFMDLTLINAWIMMWFWSYDGSRSHGTTIAWAWHHSHYHMRDKMMRCWPHLSTSSKRRANILIPIIKYCQFDFVDNPIRFDLPYFVGMKMWAELLWIIMMRYKSTRLLKKLAYTFYYKLCYLFNIFFHKKFYIYDIIRLQIYISKRKLIVHRWWLHTLIVLSIN